MCHEEAETSLTFQFVRTFETPLSRIEHRELTTSHDIDIEATHLGQYTVYDRMDHRQAQIDVTKHQVTTWITHTTEDRGRE